MPIRRSGDRGVIYVIIASVCLLIFFIGFSIIDNITKNNSIKETDDYKYEEDGKEVVVISSPKVTEEVRGVNLINKELQKLNTNSFLVKALLSSNSYMQVIYNIEKTYVSDFSLIKDTISQVIGPVSPGWYFKSQLPAIINALDVSKNRGDNLEDDWIKGVFNNDEDLAELDDSKDIILEDIILIKEPLETEDKWPMDNDKSEENSEGIDNDVSEVTKITIPPEINIKPVNLNKEKSNILIYHTHGTEAYLPITEGNFRTTNREYNVVNIGEIISNGLKEKNNNVVHIDKYHDVASYNESYAQSLKTAKEVLNKEKDVKIIFDIHRDAVGEKESQESANKRFKTVINGKEVARISIVIGPKNDNLEELKNFAFYIKYVSDQMYPGLLREIILKPYGRFNQYLSDYYALIEIGSNANTIDEAKESAKLVSNILDVVIKGIEE